MLFGPCLCAVTPNDIWDKCCLIPRQSQFACSRNLYPQSYGIYVKPSSVLSGQHETIKLLANSFQLGIGQTIVNKEKEKIRQELEAYAKGIFACAIRHPASGVG